MYKYIETNVSKPSQKHSTAKNLAMELIIATHNQHKATEIQRLLPNWISVKTLDEIECFEDIPETEHTLEGNARLKSTYISKKYHVNCFADDSGLEIDALGGEPGVYSARYAGENGDAHKNMDLVLEKMHGITNRQAKFRTVISLIIDGVETQFQGTIEGEITQKKSGTEGFGYDPIFKPFGSEATFSEMSLAEKNKISHRSQAVEKMIDFLRGLEK